MFKKVTLPSGQKIDVHAQQLGDSIWIHHSGTTWQLPLQATSRKKRSSGHSDLEEGIAAPMPGKITKLPVQPGSRVKKGEVVAVMEAMKMEYSLKASDDAQVAAIKCAVGDQVTLGQILVEFEVKQ
jgi:acetyl/propionyl-CoA carboxylase alpha subunit